MERVICLLMRIPMLIFNANLDSVPLTKRNWWRKQEMEDFIKIKAVKMQETAHKSKK